MTFSKILPITAFLFCWGSVNAQDTEIDSLKSVWQDLAVSDSLRMEALGKLVYKYIELRPDTAIYLANEMLVRAKSTNDIRAQIRALYRLGLIQEHLGNIDSAETFHKKSLNFRLILGDSALLGTGYNALAGSFYQRFEMDSAIYYFEKGLKIHQAINDLQATSNSLNNIGVCYYQLGEVRKCIEYYGQSLNIDKKLGNRGGEAIMLTNLGILYSRVGELQKALEHQRAAVFIYDQDSTLRGAVRAFHAWAAAESDVGNYNVALNGFTKAYRMAIRRGQAPQAIEALAGRALVYRRLDKNQMAKTDYEEVLALGGKSPNIYANLGALYFDLGILKKAEFFSKKALDEAVNGSIGETRDRSVAYFTLYEIYKAQGNYLLALQMHELQQEMKDSLVNSENQNLLLAKEQEFNTKFLTDSLQMVAENQAELASQEIEHQKMSNRLIVIGGILIVALISLSLFYYFYSKQKRHQAQRKLAEAQLRQQVEENRMKAIRAQFKPHFLANVQVAIQNYMDQGNAQKASEYLDNYSGMMRNVLESSDKEAVSIKQETATVVQYMELYKLLLVYPMEYKVLIDKTIDENRDQVPSLILQPLVENAIRHGITPLNEPGQILIDIRKDGEKIRIVVEDNGVGRTADAKKSMLSESGSFGLRFVKEQLDLIEKRTGKQCTFEVEDKYEEDGNPAGTKVIIAIPVVL